MAEAVAILIPVLARPHLVAPLVENIARVTPSGHTILFLTDAADTAERAAIAAAGARELPSGGSYASKINRGIAATDEPTIFLGADDLIFHAGWLEAALGKLGPGIGVVGVNDLIERSHRAHATHFLVTREYARRPTADGSPGPCCTEYTHNFTDDELIATAKHRAAYAYAADSHVQHNHPMNGSAPDDATYQKGRSAFRLDRMRYRRRTRLWSA